MPSFRWRSGLRVGTTSGGGHGRFSAPDLFSRGSDAASRMLIRRAG